MLTQKLNFKQKQQVCGFLRWTEDSHTEQREVDQFISLGRDKENLVPLNDEFISGRHCRIQKKDSEGFILQDMSSKNGTFLNGNRVFKAMLKNNDRIQIGKKEFIFLFKDLMIVGASHTLSHNPQWSKLLKSLPNIAKSNMPVLITGSSGTGKEMMAKLTHLYSNRSKGPMISVNCSALSESLIESEFFGHVKGSYTGALTHRKGAFVAANGGSLFLDEIGDLPLNLQPKLLRAIEYQEIKAVGSDQVTKTDARIIAATHQDLKSKVTHKQFRSDLYFRLNVLPFCLPDLQNRMEDFEKLLEFFCAEYNTSFSPKAITFLKKHSWPGNIRELKNTVARARALFPGEIIDPSTVEQLISLKLSTDTDTDTDTDITESNNHEITPHTVPVIKQIEKHMIIKSMIKNRGNQKKAAIELGMPRSTLCDRIKSYNINVNNYKDL